MNHKLLVVTAGTSAAGVGLALVEQATTRLDIQAVLCSIDTANLPAHYPRIRSNEWQPISIDSVYIRAAQKNVDTNQRLQKMLWADGGLPSTTISGAGRIRYAGAGAMVISYEGIRDWLSRSMTTLVRSGDGKRDLAVALIASAVGGTGSGSLEHLVEIIGDAAHRAGIPLPVYCDCFILLPGMDVDDLGLANTFALHAELAAAQKDRSSGNSIERHQGRTIMVGWGSEHYLDSQAQLQEAAATLVRVIHDPGSTIGAAFRERRPDHHVLTDIDFLSQLPSHLSSATVVTISMGRLEEQVIQRNATELISRLVFGEGDADRPRDIFLASLEHCVAGDTPESRYEHLLHYLSKELRLRSEEPNFTEWACSLPAQLQVSRIRSAWEQDKREIDQDQEIDAKGMPLVRAILAEWQRLRNESIVTSNGLSLVSLRAEYTRLHTWLASTLDVARQDIRRTVSDDPVLDALKAMDHTHSSSWFGGAEKRRKAVSSTITAIKGNLRNHLDEHARTVAIDILDELEHHCAELLRNLESVLQRLTRQRDTNETWIGAHRPLSLGLEHPLHIAALEGVEIEEYAKQVSIFALHTRRRRGLSTINATEGDQLAAFRKWLDERNELDGFFRGDMQFLLNMAREYARERVHEEVKEYSLLELLLQDGNSGMLRQRLKKAAELATSMVPFSKHFAPKCREVRYISAYYKNEEQRKALQIAADDIFQGEYTIEKSDDPTEIVVFYYVDGLAMSAVNDLRGRCYDAYLALREKEQLLHSRNKTRGVGGFERSASNSIYSGKDAQDRVMKTDVVSLIHAISEHSDDASTLPELQDFQQETLAGFHPMEPDHGSTNNVRGIDPTQMDDGRSPTLSEQ